MGIWIRKSQTDGAESRSRWYGTVFMRTHKRYPDGRIIYKRHTFVIGDADSVSEKEALDHFKLIEQEIKNEIDDIGLPSALDLPRRLRDYDYTRAGFIYFIYEGTYTKIGITLVPSQRIRNIEQGIVSNVKTSHILKSRNMLRDESTLHNLFRQYRHKGEWYSLGSCFVEEIKSYETVEDLIDYLASAGDYTYPINA